MMRSSYGIAAFSSALHFAQQRFNVNRFLKDMVKTCDLCAVKRSEHVNLEWSYIGASMLCR